MSLAVLMWLIAAVLFGVSAFVNPPRVSLLAVGMVFFVLGFLLPELA